MASKGSFLTSGQFLGVNDYLVSPNGLFFAIMQVDGNFCVYRGSGPSDNHGGLWCYNNKAKPGGQFFAIMQVDGNFCVYKGTGPSDNRGGLWCTMQIDPVVDIEISSIDYDVNAAKILRSGPAELYRQSVHNNSTQSQTSTISGSESVSETSGWSDSLAVKVGASTSFKTGVPFIAEGKVTVSIDVTNTYTWNGSTTKTKTWGFNTPVSVPPHITIDAFVSVTLSTIAVPYTLSGTVVLKSGTRMPGKIRGIYTGTNSHDLTVTFVQENPITREISSTSKAISPD